MAEVTYTAHLLGGGSVSWTVSFSVTPENERDGPGFMLQSQKIGSAGGIVSRGVFYPFSQIVRIDWTVV